MTGVSVTYDVPERKRSEIFPCPLISCIDVLRYEDRLPDPLLDASSLYIIADKELQGRAPLLSIPTRLTWRSGWGDTGADLAGCFHPVTASWTAQAYQR